MSTTPRPESEPGSARYTRDARAVSYDANAAMTGTAYETIQLADSEQAVLVARVAELEAEVDVVEKDLREVEADARNLRGTLAKVAALADDWQGRWASPRWIDELRAALASAGRPATSDGACAARHVEFAVTPNGDVRCVECNQRLTMDDPVVTP